MPEQIVGPDRARRLARKANQALLDHCPLVVESEDEIRAVRSYAEFAFGLYEAWRGGV